MTERLKLQVIDLPASHYQLTTLPSLQLLDPNKLKSNKINVNVLILLY